MTLDDKKKIPSNLFGIYTCFIKGRVIFTNNKIKLNICIKKNHGTNIMHYNMVDEKKYWEGRSKEFRERFEKKSKSRA